MVYPALSTSVYRLSEFEPAAFCWWDLKSLILHRNRSWHQSNPDPRCNSCFFVLGVRKSSRCGMVYADTGTDTYTATFIFAQEATLLTLVSRSFSHLMRHFCFVSRSKCCSCSGRICHSVGCRESSGYGCIRKLGE